MAGRDGNHGEGGSGDFAAAAGVACRTLAEVFARVRDGSASYGAVPADNSRSGSTGETYDLLLDSDGSLAVTGEVVISIEHCLLGLAGARAERIKEVRGDPRTLAECEPYLTRLGAELVPNHSAEAAAKHVKVWGSPEVAAVGPAHAAAVYGLDVLATNVQANPHNFTRYLRIERAPRPRGSRNKTALAMGLEHAPDALFLALSSVACRGINLTKIESRPIRRDPYQFVFLLELEGHVEDWPVKQALDELKAKTTMLRVLGSYPVED